MATEQTRIFIPWKEPYDEDMSTWHFYPTVLGRVIEPQVQIYPDLEWFWFSCYREEEEGSMGDCCLKMIPKDFKHFENGRVYWNSIRFRFAIDDDKMPAFRCTFRSRIEECGCAISDFREFRMLEQIAIERFLGEPRTPQRKERRAALVTSFLHVISELVLHSLVGSPEGQRYHFESNDMKRENPLGSSFESMHHMFQNMTRVPWFVELHKRMSSSGHTWEYVTPSW